MEDLKTIRRKLRRRLPPEAIKPNLETGLSSVNAAYVIERLNDVFGENGWTAEYTEVESGVSMVTVRCEFTAFMAQGERDIKRQTFGGNSNADRGDAYKGACTDALTKAASQIGIAGHVYKGMEDVKPEPVAKQVSASDQYVSDADRNALILLLGKRGRNFADLLARLKSLGVHCEPPLKIPAHLLPELTDWAKNLQPVFLGVKSEKKIDSEVAS